MELIAALLHQPQLLLLDEPTIGLDVVAQVAIQKCLREYHTQRGVTMLLTSHYMRDVEAPVRPGAGHHPRPLVYDGPLSGIIERFGQSKLVKLQFDGTGARTTWNGSARSSAARARSPTSRSSGAGGRGAGGDPRPVHPGRLSVQDPPLEQVIARVFEEAPDRP